MHPAYSKVQANKHRGGQNQKHGDAPVQIHLRTDTEQNDIALHYVRYTEFDHITLNYNTHNVFVSLALDEVRPGLGRSNTVHYVT